MVRIEFESDGMHNGSPVYCTVNAYGVLVRRRNAFSLFVISKLSKIRAAKI